MSGWSPMPAVRAPSATAMRRLTAWQGRALSWSPPRWCCLSGCAIASTRTFAPSCSRSSTDQSLGCQALAHPGIGRGALLGAVAQTVMQTAFAPLPKLPLLGHQAVAAPMWWARRVEQKLRPVFGRVGDQHAAPGNHLSLRAGPSTNARIQGAAVKVSIAFFGADLFHAPFDAHHTLQLNPMKLQRGK